MNEEDIKTSQPEAPEAPLPPETEDPKAGPHRGRAAAVAVVAAVAVIAAVAFAASPKAPAPSTGSAGSSAPVAEAAAMEPVAVPIKETAPGMDASTSPVIVRVRGEEGTTAEGVDFCHAAPAADAIAGTATLDLAPGSYTVEFLPTVNADGSINAGAEARPLEAPAKGGADEKADAEKGSVEDAGSTAAPGASAEVDTTPADKVTAEQIADLQQKTQDAISRGDSTLTGEAGQKVAEKVAENASKAPAADAGKVEEAEKKASDAAAGAKPTQAPSKTDAPSSPKADPKPSAGSKPASSSKPAAHEHKWTAVTETRWVVDRQAWDERVVERAAWDEKVQTGSVYHFYADGYETESSSDAADHGEMLAMSGKNDAYTVKAVYTTVHHPAEGHNETVTTGYRCSCGATK